MSERHFDRIRELIRGRAGIALSDAKRELVYGRLARRLRDLKLDGFDAYLDLVEAEDSEEIEAFTNALTTNLTSFFRESHHFEYLKSHVFPGLERRNAGSKRLRLWSAACSTGEEPYSLAMTLAESMGRFSGWDVRILATDLDSAVLSHARAGLYTQDRMRSISSARRERWFVRGAADRYAIKDQLRAMITFRQLNLMQEWPFRGPFDVIFCRNVVIYFDKQTQRTLFSRMVDLQPEGSYLFIGHSESLFKVSDRYSSLGKTMYRRDARTSGASVAEPAR